MGKKCDVEIVHEEKAFLKEKYSTQHLSIKQKHYFNMLGINLQF